MRAMGGLVGKRILLGITGSIAAYKAPLLVRELVKRGASVQTILTQGGAQFTTPQALATVSGKPCLTQYANPQDGTWNNHVHLGIENDLLLIAPCSAHTLGALAIGLCENLLQAVYLSARCPVIVAPAMDLDMWAHPAVQANVAVLRQRGVNVIEPEDGELASGLVGKGRMPEPEAIARWVDNLLNPKAQTWAGRKVLITAGPTREAIDPMRYLANKSTGVMGYAIAQSLVDAGAEVVLVSGPTQIQSPQGVEMVDVTSAQQMFDACHAHFAPCDLAIMAAAVADFRPAKVEERKIKRAGLDTFTLHMVANPDILASLGAIKKPHQRLVGFALESSLDLEEARRKLKAKNADLILLNEQRDGTSGAGSPTNRLVAVGADFDFDLGSAPKHELADTLVTFLNNALFTHPRP